MGREKVLLENLSKVLDVFVKTSPGAIDFVGSVNKYPDETKYFFLQLRMASGMPKHVFET